MHSTKSTHTVQHSLSRSPRRRQLSAPPQMDRCSRASTLRCEAQWFPATMSSHSCFFLVVVAQQLSTLVILFNFPLSLAPFLRLFVVVLDAISISIVDSNETIFTTVVIVFSSWTLRHLSLGLWSSRHPFCCSPARFTALQIAPCLYVGHELQPTLEAPREGLRQGEVRGAGRKLSPQLRNQLLRSGRSQCGDAPHRLGTPTRSPNRSGSKTKMYYIIQENRQICTPVYPTPRVQDNQPNKCDIYNK